MHCPVDVYIYDSQGTLCGSVIDNQIDTDNGDIFLYCTGDEKYFNLTGDDYTIKFVGNDEGAMTYQIDEYLGTELLRSIYYESIPLADGKTYLGTIPYTQMQDSEIYNPVEMENAEAIKPTSDTLVTGGDGDEKPDETYTVTFDIQGHGTALEEYFRYTEIKKGSTINSPTSPQEEGYTFTGWYKDVKCTILWDFATDVVEGNMTLYAGWEKEISETESEPETGSQTESESESQTESETESQTETESESQTEPAKKVYTVLFELQGHGIALDEYSKYTES